MRPVCPSIANASLSLPPYSQQKRDLAGLALGELRPPLLESTTQARLALRQLSGDERLLVYSRTSPCSSLPTRSACPTAPISV